MDIFLKSILLLFGLVFVYVGYRMIFKSKEIIEGIQKYKYHTTREPLKKELLFSRILGAFLLLGGLYYSALAIVFLFFS